MCEHKPVIDKAFLHDFSLSHGRGTCRYCSAAICLARPWPTWITKVLFWLFYVGNSTLIVWVASLWDVYFLSDSLWSVAGLLFPLLVLFLLHKALAAWYAQMAAYKIQESLKYQGKSYEKIDFSTTLWVLNQEHRESLKPQMGYQFYASSQDPGHTVLLRESSAKASYFLREDCAVPGPDRRATGILVYPTAQKKWEALSAASADMVIDVIKKERRGKCKAEERVYKKAYPELCYVFASYGSFPLVECLFVVFWRRGEWCGWMDAREFYNEDETGKLSPLPQPLLDCFTAMERMGE